MKRSWENFCHVIWQKYHFNLENYKLFLRYIWEYFEFSGKYASRNELFFVFYTKFILIYNEWKKTFLFIKCITMQAINVYN